LTTKAKKASSKKKNGKNGTPKNNGKQNGNGTSNARGVGINERRSAVARLRFGRHYSIQEISKTLGVCATTVKNDIKLLKEDYVGKDDKALQKEISYIREGIRLSFYERVQSLWTKLRENETENKRIKKMIRDIKSDMDSARAKDKKVSLARQMAKLVESQLSCQSAHLRIISQIGETEDQYTNQLQKLGVIKRDETAGFSLYQLFGNDHADKSDEEKEQELAGDLHIITSGSSPKNNRL
jgi:hypothetical protein